MTSRPVSSQYSRGANVPIAIESHPGHGKPPPERSGSPVVTALHRGHVMRFSTRIRAFIAALLLASPTTVLGKASPRRAQVILPTLKVGQWIQLESVIQKDAQV